MKRSKRDLSQRFWEKVDKTGDCWIWQASRNSDGYGTFSLSHSVSTSAQRVAWTITYGEIPSPYEVDHKCEVRLCVNPSHLQLLTSSENTRKAKGNKCKRGHAFDRVRLRKDGTIRQRLCSVCSGNRGISARL